MNKKILIKKGLVVAVILLFIGTCIIPSATSGLTNGKNIITVDDEPGDADFTSIKEAVNYSSSGDTIEVYSGTYPEQGIRIMKENVSLLGISHELGEGDDTGKPFIKGNGFASVIQVEASHVIVSNFIIENPYYGIRIGTSMASDQNNNTISDCIIRNTPKGISVGDVGKNIRIFNNEISNCTSGISAIRKLYTFWRIMNITGNVITDCVNTGIRFEGTRQNVSGNKIRRCRTGIEIYGGSNNIIYRNDINDCSVGISSIRYGRNTITKNNFKNYSWIGCWWKRDLDISIWGLIKYKKDRWIGNYWDTWTGIGPKKILGKLTIGISIFNRYYLTIPIPRFDHDWHPASEPYDIGV